MISSEKITIDIYQRRTSSGFGANFRESLCRKMRHE